jgi:hypothetical protein
MRRCLFLVLVGAMGMLLVPSIASAAVSYRTFVGCDDLAVEPIPSHTCELGDFPAAYFESSEETEYEVCVEFPNEEVLCAEGQMAEAGVLYENSITSEMEGLHLVAWFVGETEVGSFAFRIDAPEPPPVPPVVVPPPVASAPTPAPVAAVNPAPPSPLCLTAQGQVTKLKGRLRKARTPRQKAKLRKALTAARAFADKSCG